MKKLIAPLILSVALTMTGCAATDAAPNTSTTESESAETAPQIPNLVGLWKQSNASSEDAYQQATITADTITVEWVSDGGDTTSTYWVGTFAAPTDANEQYVWTSERDAEATESALLASTDDTKQFTFDGDVISYKVSALGTTTTVKLTKN